MISLIARHLQSRSALAPWVLLCMFISGPAVAVTYQATPHATGISIPWGMVWLPDGDLLVSDRKGEILRFRDGLLIGRINGVPTVHANGQGGLMDLELHPDFVTNGQLYLSLSSPAGEGDGSNTAIVRARLAGNNLTGLQVLYKASPNTPRGQHYGSRIEFDRDGYLFFSIGDRGARDENPQDVTRDGGKVYRLHDDGRVPVDNPLVSRPDAKTAVYSWGHRNPQGMAMNPATGRIWVHEHGPRGGDEVNIIAPGTNYGWPILSYGINYSGSEFAEGTEREGFESPIHYWVPSIAPSGMAFVTSDRYPDWRGHLLVGSLKFGYCVLLRLEGDAVVSAEPVLEGVGRVRNVRQGPDGYLYLGVEGQGIMRVEAN